MTASAGAGAFGLSRRLALLLFAVVLLLRLSIVAQFRGNYDSESFRIVAELVSSGSNVYASTDRYNYSPVWAYVLAGLWSVARSSFTTFVLLVGLLQTAADVAAAALVLAVARRLGRPEDEARRAALLFFSNPVSALASGAHGQFDGLAVLLLLAAILTAMGDGLPRRAAAVVALLSASLLVKHVTAFHPLLFWRRVRRPGLSGAAVGVPYAVLAISFLPFARAGRAIWEHVVVYASRGARPAALSAFVEFPEGGRAVVLLLLAGAALWAIREGRELEIPRAALLLWLAILTFLPSYAIQYLVWPLAVGALYPSAGLGIYCLTGALFHSAFSLELDWPVHASSLATWLAGLFWLVTEAVRARRAKALPRGILAAATV